MMAIDAVSTGLLAAAALAWEGTRRATHVNTTVIILQLISLCGESKFCRALDDGCELASGITAVV